jgi:CheY-like chemotaxis protein
MMDGRIQVASEYGKGSTFSVRLRQQIVEGAVPIGKKVAENLWKFCYADHRRDRSSKLVRTALPYARVLVVDDVTTNLDVARGLLKPYGMKIDCVGSGRAAIKLVQRGEPVYDAIFMDHMMPEMDGVEAVRIIREEIGTEYAQKVPIIALTANAVAGSEAMFLSHGFQAFIAKPIDVFVLDAVLNRWVRRKEKDLESESGRQEAEIHASMVEQMEEDAQLICSLPLIPGLNQGRGLMRFGCDTDIYFGVLRSYVHNTPRLLEKVKNPEKNKLKDYAIVVHGLKGSNLSIGADELGAMAGNLEKAADNQDFAYVMENNALFVKASELMLDGLRALLSSNTKPKPKKSEPDSAALMLLLDASREFDIDGVDAAIEELGKYEYEKGSELIEEIKEQITVMGFEQITELVSRALEK